jgi:hypothetical protein
MAVEVDPWLKQQFEQNLADHKASVARVDATLAQREREITEAKATSDAKFDAERGALLEKMKEQYQKPAPESDKPRLVGWTPTTSTGAHEGLMTFGAADDLDEAPPPPPPVHAPPPAPARTPAAPPRVQPARSARHRRDVEQEEDDYSQQTWLQE